ncbi:hypothetical protein CEXT_10731 [Caerostris extrusa]|uniref:Uncharacterized protein n=1 Tax=Caerostris extrusa TaxID=172846 RepID=A0AAV4VMU0_CAEEX|nr:hypothetical protein CEXT_10731 [Caerostris extrusa]
MIECGYSVTLHCSAEWVMLNMFYNASYRVYALHCDSRELSDESSDSFDITTGIKFMQEDDDNSKPEISKSKSTYIAHIIADNVLNWE